MSKNTLVEITGWEKITTKMQKEIKQKSERATKEALIAFIPQLEEYLRQELADFYTTHDDRKMRDDGSYFYDRTGEFADSISAQLSQGRGYYGIKIFFDNNLISVHPRPECGTFNAHANFKNVKIDAEELADLQEYQYGVISFIEAKAQSYINENLSSAVKASWRKAVPQYYKDY